MEDLLNYILDWAWYLAEEAGVWIGANPLMAGVLGLVLTIAILTVTSPALPRRGRELPVGLTNDPQTKQAIEQAFEHAKQALFEQRRISPEAGRILRDLNNGRMASAVTYFRQMAEEREQSAAEAWRHHGAMCAYEQDALRAIEAFERAEQLRPVRDDARDFVVRKLRP